MSAEPQFKDAAGLTLESVDVFADLSRFSSAVVHLFGEVIRVFSCRMIPPLPS